ncbi:transcriptional regulator, LysR family [Tolumonas auensis DSM 9187]|uniref:Transcriptional regulator, LysR family n=1 Tax=Tolumonas auensis (strain DSM 9187 / NBRC 110442 / TA 4) TaxID=595494 RepID=C4L7H7_TOLAT|nr:LysR family transcriptional regulator [Tolumonas auensis]ACQ93593.1 transcriptional regulator, LysR family [Tolumonas auensis DSM 9187]
MLKENINEFLLFIALAQEGSFTKAAAKLGMSQSALSHAIKALEERIKLRLFNRTTRSVSLSDAGERLLTIIEPRFTEIEDELQLLNEDYHKAAGNIRLSSSDYAAQYIIWPVVKQFAKEYPDIKVEINVENKLTDIVTERYDAGVRFGDQVAKDMIAVRISPDIRFLIVCTPAYLEGKSEPLIPDDLLKHQCINMRLNSNGGMYAWEFERDGKSSKLRVHGQFAFNSPNQVLDATLDNFGFAYLPDTMVNKYLEAGQLVSVLKEWSPLTPGLHLYYPSRRQHKLAFMLLLKALHYKC